jgi:uncharacterized membrane protein (DUF4010 family)
VKDKPHLLYAASAAALLSILSSLILFLMVLGATSQALMNAMLLPLIFAGLAVLVASGFCLYMIDVHEPPEVDTATSAFKISHAFMIAATIGVVMLVSAWLRQLLGDSGTLLAAWVVGLAEIHAAAVSVSQLAVPGAEQPDTVRWGVMGILASSAVAKSSMAFACGGRQYGGLVSAGLLAMILAGSLTMWL